MRIREGHLLFNVIFLPHTVEALLPFMRSLLEHSSSCRFRLVANGCADPERRRLADFCGASRRLEWLCLGNSRPVSHGTALSLLQRREKSPFFAFMDSDVFATRPYLDPLLDSPRAAHAVFSGAPFWADGFRSVASSREMILGGLFSRLEDGACIGTSFLAIYDNRSLSDCIASTGIDFRLYTWRRIPAPVQRELQRTGRVKALYDTGKLINILLANRGRILTLRQCSGLVHVGGMSLVAAPNSKQRLTDCLRRNTPARLLSLYRSLKMGQPVTPDETRREQALWDLRMEVSGHCLSRLDPKASGKSRPGSSWQAHPDLAESLKRLDGQLQALLFQYGSGQPVSTS